MKANIIIAQIMINTGMTVPELASSKGISKQALYAAINGELLAPRPVAIIVEAAGKPVSELWPEAKQQTQEAA